MSWAVFKRRWYWIAGLLGFLLPVGFPGAWAQSSGRPVNELNPNYGINLADLNWSFADGEDFYEERRKGLLVRIRLPFTTPLKFSHGSGWLMCLVPVAPLDFEEAAYYDTEILIGHIEGADEIYWNNTLIGQTGYTRLTGGNRPRRYAVPSEALRFGGLNLLRIHLKPPAGTREIPALHGPITAAPLAPTGARRQLKNYKEELRQLTREVFRLSRYRSDFLPLLDLMAQRENLWLEIDQADQLIEQDRLKLLGRSFEEIEKGLRLFRRTMEPVKKALTKIETTRYEQDMLTIAASEDVFARDFKDLSVLGWKAPSKRPPGFSRWGWFYEDGLPALPKVTPTFIEGPDGRRISLKVGRVLHIDVVDINWVSKTYLVRAEMELHGQTEIAEFEVLTSVFFPGVLIFPRFKPYGEVFKVESLQKFFDLPVEKIVRLAAKPEAELGRVFLGWKGAEDDVPAMLRFTTHQREPLQLHVTACFPGGLRRIDTRQWEDPEQTPKDLGAFPYIEYLARNLPWDCREYYRVDEKSGTVQVYCFFEYYFRPSQKRLILVPPVLSLARKAGYPVESNVKWFDLGIETFAGPLQGGFSRNGMLHYALPIPPLEERAYPNVASAAGGQFSWRQALADDWQEKVASEAANPLALGPQLRACCNGWFQTTSQTRGQASSQFREYLTAELSLDTWPEVAEPFSGLAVSWRQASSGDGADDYNIERGNALALYTLYKGCQYSGQWNQLRENQSTLGRMWSWIAQSDDWAWMRCSNARHGYGTGSADATLAVFGGALAYAKINQQLRRPAKAEEGLYVLSRTATALFALFQKERWEQNARPLGERQWPVAFLEGEGIQVSSLDEKPEEIASLISCDGIPVEAISFLLRDARASVENYAEAFERSFPDWTQAAAKDNLNALQMPYLYLRTRLGDSADQVNPILAAWRENRQFAWTAPAVLSEVEGAGLGVRLLHWEPYFLRDITLQGSKLKLILRKSYRVSSNLDLQLITKCRPSRVTYNGATYEQWSYDDKTGLFQVKGGNLPGWIQLEVEFEPASGSSKE